MHVSELDLKFTIQTKHFFKKVKQHTARPTNERLQPTNRTVHITNRNHEHSSIKQKKKLKQTMRNVYGPPPVWPPSAQQLCHNCNR